jgi:hypothetical protein
MFRYKLRTLLLVIALGPPLLWAGYLWYVLIEETFLRGLGPSASTVEELRRLDEQERAETP